MILKFSQMCIILTVWNLHTAVCLWGKEWLGFPDLSSGQKPWWNWYFTIVVNFGEVRRAQFAKSSLLTTMLVPWNLFRSFKVCLDAKERVGCRNWKAMRSYCIYSIPGKTAVLVPEFTVEDLPLAELQPRFLCLQWRTCPWAEHSDDDDVCL